MNGKQPYSDDPKICNRERAQDAEAALVAYFAIKNPAVYKMDPDAEGRETMCDLLTDLRHWARWRDEDFAAAVSMSEIDFTDEVAEETEQKAGGSK